MSDELALAEVMRFNQKLAWLPRFRIRNRFIPLVIQSLLRVSQVGGAAKLAMNGFKAENNEFTELSNKAEQLIWH